MNIVKHTSWHFMIGPIKSKPFQFIIIYPITRETNPNNDVEAPTFSVSKEHTAENRFPPMADTKKIIAVSKAPKVNSTLEHKTINPIVLHRKCIKSAWSTAAVISLHTSPYRRSRGEFAPSFINVFSSTSRNYPSFYRPKDTSVMNKANSINKINVVKDKHLKTGQQVEWSISP